MRLLTHNALKNNAKDARGKGYPLKISSTLIKVDETPGASEARQVAFVKGVVSSLEWSALVQAAKEMGIPTLPETLTMEMADDVEFCKALYHVLMNVHLIDGTLTCPVTGREFPVKDGIPNMMIEEDEAEGVRL